MLNVIYIIFLFCHWLIKFSFFPLPCNVHRFENLSFEKVSGKAKVMGTMICVGGAMLLTLYKGIEVHMWPIKFNLLHHANEATAHKKVGESGTFALGIVLAVTSCICYSLWIVLLVSKYIPHFSIPFSLSLNCILSFTCVHMFELGFELHGSRYIFSISSDKYKVWTK